MADAPKTPTTPPAPFNKPIEEGKPPQPPQTNETIQKSQGQSVGTISPETKATPEPSGEIPALDTRPGSLPGQLNQPGLLPKAPTDWTKSARGDPDAPPLKDLIKPTGKEVAFYCSLPDFYIAKSQKPAIQFEGRWLITRDEVLVEHIIQTAKDMARGALPISIIKVPMSEVGKEPTPEMLNKALGGDLGTSGESSNLLSAYSLPKIEDQQQRDARERAVREGRADIIYREPSTTPQPPQATQYPAQPNPNASREANEAAEKARKAQAAEKEST